MEEFIGEGGRGLGFGLVVEDKVTRKKLKNQILLPIPESEFESDSESYFKNIWDKKDFKFKSVYVPWTKL